MSRVAKKPIALPANVSVTLEKSGITIKGAKGTLHLDLPSSVSIVQQDKTLHVACNDESMQTNAISGSVRAIVNNMVKGVSEGFQIKLELVGVGYRAQVQGKNLNLSLGFSHPVAFPIPAGITIETPSQTEIVIKGIDKQLIGETAAKIRAYRAPEPYKGKGVRYAGEKIILKETKKK